MHFKDPNHLFKNTEVLQKRSIFVTEPHKGLETGGCCVNHVTLPISRPWCTKHEGENVSKTNVIYFLVSQIVSFKNITAC